MNAEEFASLKKGDIVYNPAESDDEWTIVAFVSPSKGWLAIRGKIEMNHKSRKFWDCMTILSDEDRLESMECIGLKMTYVFNPENWIKEIGSE